LKNSFFLALVLVPIIIHKKSERKLTFFTNICISKGQKVQVPFFQVFFGMDMDFGMCRKQMTNEHIQNVLQVDVDDLKIETKNVKVVKMMVLWAEVEG